MPDLSKIIGWIIIILATLMLTLGIIPLLIVCIIQLWRDIIIPALF